MVVTSTKANGKSPSKSSTKLPKKSPTKSLASTSQAKINNRQCKNQKKSTKSYSSFMMKDAFVQKIIHAKFSQYLLKVSDNIKFKISVSQASSNCNRARISIIIINECTDYILKKMNKIVQLNNSKTSNTKLEKYSFSDMIK